METKLCLALLSLLLVHLGSAVHDGNHTTTTTSSSSVSEAPAAEPLPGSSLPDSIGHVAAAPSPNDTNPHPRGGLINNATTEEETVSVTPEPKRVNDSHVSPSETAVPRDDGKRTNQSTPQPPTPPPPASHTPPNTTTTTTAAAAPKQTAHNTTEDTQTTTQTTMQTTMQTSTQTTMQTSTQTIMQTSMQTTTPTTTQTTTQTTAPATTQTNTQTTNAPHVTSNSSTLIQTHLPTSVPTPEPAGTETTTTTARSTSTPGTSSSRGAPASESTTLTPPQDARVQPSTQAKHHDDPSQLNVGGDPTMVHDSPTLDPLLAGLVSAFIITAVIITLLLFLKLRRRDNRPEFRRLQDLPMDDMLEDTPLSMYSY